MSEKLDKLVAVQEEIDTIREKLAEVKQYIVKLEVDHVRVVVPESKSIPWEIRQTLLAALRQQAESFEKLIRSLTDVLEGMLR